MALNQWFSVGASFVPQRDTGQYVEMFGLSANGAGEALLASWGQRPGVPFSVL